MEKHYGRMLLYPRGKHKRSCKGQLRTDEFHRLFGNVLRIGLPFGRHGRLMRTSHRRGRAK